MTSDLGIASPCIPLNISRGEGRPLCALATPGDDPKPFLSGFRVPGGLQFFKGVSKLSGMSDNRRIHGFLKGKKLILGETTLGVDLLFSRCFMPIGH